MKSRQTTPVRTMRRWLTAAVLGAGLLTACDPATGPDPEPQLEDEDTEQMREADRRAASHGVNALDGTPGFIQVGNFFIYEPPIFGEVDLADPVAVRRHAVASVQTRLDITFAVLGCEAEVVSDGEQTVSLLTQGCRLLLWELDTDVEATAEVVTEPCDAGECATAVRWDLDVGELKTGLIGLPKSGYVGPLTIEAPTDPEQRMQWTSHPGFQIETGLGLHFDTLSTATWRIHEDECIEFDMGARLTLEEREDELDELIGDVVISARGLERCPDRCATAGQVQVSFGAGRVIQWTHDEDDTITVVGPRGREVEVTPPCADQG